MTSAVSGLFSTLTNKAQAVLNTGQPSANSAAAQGGSSSRSHAFEAIQHQLRSLGQQYATTTPIQKLITNEKGVAIDFDSVSQDSKAQSKELYTWGQAEHEDLKDVSDRLAYLNFVQGSLASSLAVKLDAARAPLKSLRDLENSLTPRRNIRAGIELQINRIEHEQTKGMEQRLSQLKDQLRKAKSEDEASEKQAELLKRKAIRESETLKWEALREYGEKLALISQAAVPIVDALPVFPPTPTEPYGGTAVTAAVRASLQKALDNYKTGQTSLNLNPGAELNRSDTRSFGETHATELSRLASHETLHTAPGIPITPPVEVKGLPPTSSSESHISTSNSPPVKSPPIDPAALNMSPAPIPDAVSPVVALAASAASPDASVAAAANLPTVAETGVPLSAGEGGPGPASGSLRDLRAASDAAGPRSGGLPGNSTQGPAFGQSFAPPAGAPPSSTSKYESAEDEKKRLQREDRERLLAPSGQAAATPSYESSEDEKKRLEREERERILAAGSTQAQSDLPKKHTDDDLPPYQDF